MAKDYVRPRQLPKRNRNIRPLLFVIAAFILGYLIANFFDFASLSAWVSRHFGTHKTKIAVRKAPHHLVPKPKFEFYTLLAKDNNASPSVTRPDNPSLKPSPAIASANIASARAVRTLAAGNLESNRDNKTTNVIINPPKKETYFIQIASFNKRSDADHLKAELVLKGFDVTITPILKEKMVWYRVTVGTFHSRQDAEKVQLIMARREHIQGMVRKATS